MTPRRVLISGAGIAGPTLAYWLARHGLRPTIVERAQGPRSSGNPVDVRGPALPVAERMGIMPKLREAATTATAMTVVDDRGRVVARVRMPSAGGTGAEVEIPRADLATVVFDAVSDDAEVLFDDTIVTLKQDGDGVDVTFERTGPRRFDLVVGADGLHSVTRRSAFGPESGFVEHLGIYVSTVALGEPSDHPHEVLMHNTPGRLVSIHPSRGNALAAFIFRSPAIAGFDYRDTAQHKRIVADAYADAGWRVPELLDRLATADDVYFDAVSVVRLPAWVRGRVALLGDAASCVSLFGDGSSLAMAGAYTLAEELASTDDQATALRRYEDAHRRLVEPKQRRVNRAAGLLIPRTRLGLAARNLAARLWTGRT
jgi:2-polyprenyl-6-methoxyphenol hydroxylase-like FAD-dependent oxidoreductase